jgi:ABC-type branched-subunit amino acid transport system substrate-binding protein
MAVKEINDAGGFKVGNDRYILQLVERDNRTVPTAATAAQKELVQDEGIKFIYGPTYGPLADQAQALTSDQAVIHFSAATLWQVKGYVKGPSKPYLFSTQPGQDDVNTARAQLVKRTGAKIVGLIGEESDSTAAINGPLTQLLKSQGMQVVDVRFPSDATDLTAYVTKLKSQGVETIYLSFPQARATEITRLVVDLKAAPKGFVSTNVNPDVALSKAIGKPVPIAWGSTYSGPSFDYPPNDRVKKFADALKVFDPKFPTVSASTAFFSYDYVYMLVEAMKQTKTVSNVPVIAQALQTMKYEGAAGTICYRSDARIPRLDIGTVYIENGKIDSGVVKFAC